MQEEEEEEAVAVVVVVKGTEKAGKDYFRGCWWLGNAVVTRLQVAP